MFSNQTDAAQSQTGMPPQRIGKHRVRMAVATLMAALLLSACGGGSDVGTTGNFNIGVTVGGQFFSDTLVASGGSLDLAVPVGKSIIFDAGEPVVWTMYVGGSVISGGVQLHYAGADITATTLSSYAVVLDTYAPYLLQRPIPITLIATSTYDSVQVATVNLLITN